MNTVSTLTINPSIDISTAVAEIAADRKLRCDRPRLDPGGGGINVARVIHRLGGACLAFHAAGGHTGRLLRDLLDAEGVGHSPIDIEESTRENVTVTDRAGGHQYRFVMPGPRLAEGEWKRCLDVALNTTPSPDYIVASGSLPEGVPADFYARLAREAHQRQCRLILDTSGGALRAAAGERVYLVKPNRREAEQLIGRPLSTEPELRQALRQFVRDGHAEAVVVSLGSEGALLVTRASSERLAAPAVRVESRIGAGDSMVAGIVLGLARGNSLRQAVLLGLAAGSATVMTPGTELCRPGDVAKLHRALTGGSAVPSGWDGDDGCIPTLGA